MSSLCSPCPRATRGRPNPKCDSLARLACALKRNRLVIFCGAGVSASIIPTAKEFLEQQGLAELAWEKATSVMQYRPTFWRDFQNTFNLRDPTEIHRWLAHLGASCYITTNYDQLLERALFDYVGEENVCTVRSDVDIGEVPSRRICCVKLHGDAGLSQPSDLFVLSESDYWERMLHPKRVDNYVSYLFATREILFVGYSLSDSNVGLLLRGDGKRSAAPERFVALVECSEQLRKYLETLPITLIDLKTDGDGNLSKPLARFLRSLWKNTDALGNFLINNNEENLRPLDEILSTAILERKRGDFKSARSSFELLWNKRWDIVQQTKLLPAFLWLFVSLHDKLEEWATLSRREPLIDELLDEFRKSAPEAIYLAIEAGYRHTLAHAYLRGLRFDDAKKNINLACRWQPGDYAPAEHHVLHANVLTAKAILSYSDWCVHGDHRDPQLLKEAENLLRAAGKLYGRYANENQEGESHHLGRFHGAWAFIWSAKGKHPRAIQEATKSINPARPETRSEFGKVAALYCHAFVLWKEATCRRKPSRDSKMQDVLDQLKEAQKAIDQAQQIMVHSKLQTLMDRISAELAGGSFEPSAYVRRLIEDGKCGSCDQWLMLPLN